MTSSSSSSPLPPPSLSSALPASSRFVDYFVVCGLDLNSGLEPDRLSGDNLHCTPLERPYKSKVLAHFPDNVPWNPFDAEAVGMLCLPRGLHFRTCSQTVAPLSGNGIAPDPTSNPTSTWTNFHPFIITREDGTRSYGFAWTFYEEVCSIEICVAMQTLQAMHLAELSNSQSRTLRTSGTGHLINDSHFTRSLPRSFKLNNRRRSSGTSSSQSQSQSQSIAAATSTAINGFYDIDKDKLMVTKCLCLIVQLPLVNACRRFLVGLGNRILSAEPSPLHLECYVHNVLYDVAVPSPGSSAVFQCFGQKVVYQRPAPNELPLFEYSLKEFFRILGVDNVLQLFTSVLLENQVLLYSRDYRKLMLVAECVTMLLFPFTWQHVYVPILPASLRHFLDAPVPYIMGLHNGASNVINAMTADENNWTFNGIGGGGGGDCKLQFEAGELIKSCPPLQVPGEANLCFVDIDCGIIQPPEDLPQFPHLHEFIQELTEHLNKLNCVPEHQHHCDRNSNTNNSPGSFQNPNVKYRRKKQSWGYDRDSGVSSTDVSDRSSNDSVQSNHMDILQQSEALQKITAIARRTGVITSLDDLQKPSSLSRLMDREGNLNNTYPDVVRDPENQTYLDELKFNNTIREIFLNRFTHMFIAYEHFVIQPSPQVSNLDLDQWLNSRETMQNFDKATFLSDQPEPHLPFLSRFLETQMFVTLIDHKIMSQWEEFYPSYIGVFDKRIKTLKDIYGDSLVRTPSYECCTTIKETEILLEKRMSCYEFIASPPQPLDLPGDPKSQHRQGFFPTLDSVHLNKAPVLTNRSRRHGNKHTRKAERPKSLSDCAFNGSKFDHKEADELAEKFIQEARNKNPRQPVLSEMSAAVIAQTNWKFVEQLLRECKVKTKRMLVEKMGQEAVDLGHGEISITGVEENTLIGSLCDLLERIWSHGLQSKQGKSALWSHLIYYQKQEDNKGRNLDCIDSTALTPVRTQSCSVVGLPELLLSIKSGSFISIATQLAHFDLSSMAPELDASFRRSRQDMKKKGSTRSTSDVPGLKPVTLSLTADMRNVQQMTDIRTDIGHARAWVRLSLEKKLLSKHLKKLLSDSNTLRKLYKRYAFLRCDDEKEQFLYHLLSLNAVDYFCFTNAFTNTVITYRVVIFTSRKYSGSTTSANAWVCLSGNLGETGMIQIPRSTLELVFRHKNLGILTTLRLGHDNSGMSPNWMIEHVVVRNEVTGHTYKFPCGRWLGRGIDDGSTERLLVGELVPLTTDNEELMETCRTPPRCRSPNMPRRTTEAKMSVSEIQQILADAVNNIVKHYYKPEKERGSLTILLCGEIGLVYCLEQVFLYGFKSSRLFGRHLYLWDFFVKVQAYFVSVLTQIKNESLELRSPTVTATMTPAAENMRVMASYCRLVSKINVSSQAVGKDGKFQLFVCLATRDHLLDRMILCISSTPIAEQMYEEQSFLRDPHLVTFLIQILESLDEFSFLLESSLTKGIDLSKK